MLIKTLLQLALIAVLPVILSVIIYFIEKTRLAKKIPYALNQIMVGILFGGLAVLGTEFGVDIGGAVMNARDAAPICAGLLFGAAGAISVCSTNGVTPTINFSTIASMFACFLPLFFSQFINKFCNKQIAVLMGCVAYEFIQIGFGQISSVKAFFTSDVYKVVEAAVLVLFLIYLNNEDLILRKRKNYA